jgi:hypothetical protein
VGAERLDDLSADGKAVLFVAVGGAVVEEEVAGGDDSLGVLFVEEGVVADALLAAAEGADLVVDVGSSR